ncbi:MAG: glycosyltransferase family 87 protein [Pseudomonadota bacterium]
MEAEQNFPYNRHSIIVVLGLGITLVMVQWLVQNLSHRFAYDTDVLTTPIVAFVTIQIFAGLCYLLAVALLYRLEVGRTLFALAILAGIVMRLVLFGSTPILEVDFYRYLWDGAVSANGFNPYQYEPLQASGTELHTLSKQSGAVLERINYQHLRTIYPPLTQAFFAIAYWIDSWNLNAWRTVLLVADSIGFLMIIALLKKLRLPTALSLIYWWNPLLLQQTYNAAHMDILLVAPLVGFIWLMIDHRYWQASCLLVIAAGIKLWPLVLLPFVLRPLIARPRELMLAILAGLVLFVLLIFPVFLFGLGENSGLGAFANHWQRNSGIFPVIESSITSLVPDPAFTARLVVAVLVGAVAVFLGLKRNPLPERLIQYLLAVVALLFLLSPAQFPWYTLWFLPLLCFYRSFALLLLSALMPVYYLKFYSLDLGMPELYDQILVWIQYLPVLILLVLKLPVPRTKSSWQTSHS